MDTENYFTPGLRYLSTPKLPLIVHYPEMVHMDRVWQCRRLHVYPHAAHHKDHTHSTLTMYTFWATPSDLASNDFSHEWSKYDSPKAHCTQHSEEGCRRTALKHCTQHSEEGCRRTALKRTAHSTVRRDAGEQH